LNDLAKTDIAAYIEYCLFTKKISQRVNKTLSISFGNAGSSLIDLFLAEANYLYD